MTATNTASRTLDGTARHESTGGWVIRRLRKELGISRQELAVRAGVSTSMVGRLERDEVPTQVRLACGHPHATWQLEAVGMALGLAAAERDASSEAASAV